MCETALKDYKYYRVCKKYCKLLIQLYETNTEGVDANQVRNGFEKVVEIYGLDVNRSVKFWEPYLEVEKSILESMTNSG